MDKTSLENEAAIQAKGLNAPRLTPELIEAAISSEHYVSGRDLAAKNEHHVVWHHETINQALVDEKALGCLTLCILVLQNGFTIVGKSACASPENYDRDIGNKIAREDAVRQIWALEGYLLRDHLYRNQCLSPGRD